MRINKLVVGVLVSMGVVVGAHAQADNYPNKPIKMVVAYPPGGAADKLARPISERLSAALGQNIIMDYKPGGGATIGADYTAKQPADGYTLHITDSGPFTIVPSLRKLGYDSVKDFTPLAMIGGGGVVVVVLPDSPAKDLKTLIELSKKDPAKWSYGTSGVGGVGHLAGEQLKKAAGLDVTHIPYKGGAPAIVEVLGGHVPVLFSSLGAAAPHIKAGKLKALAVTSADRSSMFPDVPTIAELGFPGFDATIWFGLVAPAGLPPAINDRLVAELGKIMKDPAVQNVVRSEAYEPMVFTQQQMADRIKSDLKAWSETAKAAGLVK